MAFDPTSCLTAKLAFKGIKTEIWANLNFCVKMSAKKNESSAGHQMYAHSRPGKPIEEWELLVSHLHDVSTIAGGFARHFGCWSLASVAGQLHDIGKASAAYQAYIAAPRDSARKGPDHSTAGAREAERLYPNAFGRILSYAIAGHHAGLADFDELRTRVQHKQLEPYSEWKNHVGDLLSIQNLVPQETLHSNARAGFSIAFLTRMIFSCLVDADFLATERFYTGQERESFLALKELETRLGVFLAAKRASDTALNRLRAQVLDHAVSKAVAEPGLFTLTVPTGGGKTLTSLAFALAHARRHGLRRVIYVIPYTSIIEQTASVFRDALQSEADILEHHASFDWDAPRAVEDADDEGPRGLAKLQKAAENWDAPIVVTTAVQFFESLFACRTSKCRKLHNIAGSVVILDEAQTLPLRLLRPCMAAIDELAANYRTSIVLCTATQPALSKRAGFVDRDLKPRQEPMKVGFDIGEERELAPCPETLYSQLKRVEVVRRPDKARDDEILARFHETPQMLCIVNNRCHARDLFDALKGDPEVQQGSRHLTTLMCAVHRRAVLADVRARLKSGEPVRLVSTSLIEAGVDISFPEVWRASAGLDSIAQAAGRCNREGELDLGRVVVFDPADGAPPKDLKPLISAAEAVFRAGLDPLSLEGVRRYFQEAYWRRGPEAMDVGILRAIAERYDPETGEGRFDFETIARDFKMIEDTQATVVVPYDETALETLDRLKRAERPSSRDLRKLQQYAVSIPKSDRATFLAMGALVPVHAGIGDAFLRFADMSHYRPETGVDLAHPERRDAASCVM